MTTLRELLKDADPLRHEPVIESWEVPRQVMHVPAQETRRSWSSAVLVGLVLIAVAVSGFRVWSQARLDAAVRFEVRLAESNPVPGLTAASVDGSTRMVYLHPDAVVTNSDIATARVVPDGSSFSVEVLLTAAGAEKMRRATERHIGRPVAILVDGEVVIAPIVRGTIGDSALVTGEYTKAEAERIVAGVAR